MTQETNPSSGASARTGVAYAIAAFASWGVLPVYWKQLHHLSAGEILAHRILWSFLFVAAILLLYGRWQLLKAALSKRSTFLGVLACGLLISANWFIYIWAVNSNHVVESSLGYYINPLFSVALGTLVLKERLDLWQRVSLALAAAGVLVLTVEFGHVPWVALSLALTFALYGLAKKLVNVDALVSLALETSLVMPVALVYLAFLGVTGGGSFGHDSLFHTLLLMGGGVVTALPLLWFAEGTKRVPLSTIGFIQYLSPTITLLIGVMLYGEPFTATHWISFGCIWGALALYTLSRALPKPLQAGKAAPRDVTPAE